jgi:hypothetical protein
MATDVHNAGAFRVFLGTVGFALGFFGVEYLVEPAGGNRQFGVSLLALALVTEAAAFKWPVIALRAKSRAKLLVVVSVSVLVGVAVQRFLGRPWFVAVIAGMSVLGTYVVSASIAFVIRLRIDVDKYVMPRMITKQQADAIQKNVQGRGSTVTVKVNSRDGEATQYAGQLFNVLRKTAWNVEMSTEDAPPLPLNDGLCYHMTGQNNAPDPRNPGGELQALVDALQKAGIRVNGGGGQAAGEYKMFLLVGHRPVTLTGPSLRSKIGQWIMRTWIMRAQ